MEQLNPSITIKDEVERFIFNWHEFPFDYWWRKKYNIPFGSSAHREMNFIDEYIEYKEQLMLTEVHENYKREKDDEENQSIGLPTNKKVIKMTSEQIDDDYDNLNLEDFNTDNDG